MYAATVLQEGNHQLVELLLAHGANPADTLDGSSALYLSARKGNVPTALALIGAGIDVNARCPFDGAAAIHQASQHGNLEFVQLLLSRGAGLDAPGPKGRVLAKQSLGQAITP